MNYKINSKICKILGLCVVRNTEGTQKLTNFHSILFLSLVLNIFLALFYSSFENKSPRFYVTFSPALLLKTEVRGHSENLTKHKVIMLLSYRERLISINHKDSSARGRKNDNVVLSPKGLESMVLRMRILESERPVLECVTPLVS